MEASESDERVEESPEGRDSFPAQIAVPCFGGPFDSLGGTPSLRVTVGLSLGASESASESKNLSRYRIASFAKHNSAELEGTLRLSRRTLSLPKNKPACFLRMFFIE